MGGGLCRCTSSIVILSDMLFKEDWIPWSTSDKLSLPVVLDERASDLPLLGLCLEVFPKRELCPFRLKNHFDFRHNPYLHQTCWLLFTLELEKRPTS